MDYSWITKKKSSNSIFFKFLKKERKTIECRGIVLQEGEDHELWWTLLNLPSMNSQKCKKVKKKPELMVRTNHLAEKQFQPENIKKWPRTRTFAQQKAPLVKRGKFLILFKGLCSWH